MLETMRVVSFCHYLQGPAASQYLADMGADVIKVEPPKGAFERHWAGAKAFVGDDRVSAFFLCANRNKRSFAVDLKRPEAREIVHRLIEGADVVLENFRVGVMDRLGFGYEEVRKRKPDIIYASGTGFGGSGPMVHRPGQDLIIQALSGLVAATGTPERPTPVGCAAADQHGAALLAMGIVAAYVKRLQTGRGTRIDGSLLNAGIDLQTEPLTLYFSKGADSSAFARDPHLGTWFHEAPYGVYRLADGRFVALSMNDAGRLAAALGSAQLERLRDVDRYDERDLYARTVAEELAGRTFEDLAPALDAHGIWYAPVQSYDELRDDPQVRHNRVFREIEVGGGARAVLVNHPLRYDGEVPGLRRMPLRIGQDTREVLAALGYAEAEIDALIEDNIVIAPDDAARAATGETEP